MLLMNFSVERLAIKPHVRKVLPVPVGPTFFARILFIGQAKLRIRSNQSERELVLDGELQEELLLQGF